MGKAWAKVLTKTNGSSGLASWIGALTGLHGLSSNDEGGECEIDNNATHLDNNFEHVENSAKAECT